MISLYSGTPGSGKSLHVAKDIRDRLILGKPVICNFEIAYQKFKRANFTYVSNEALKPAYMISYSASYFADHAFREGAILLVIDECQLLFNAREWQITGRAEWLSFFTQHRKYGYNVVLVAQFDRMIDRQIRSLIEYEYIHRKASNFGVGGTILSILSGGSLFCAVQMWYPLKARIGSELFHARKRYYSLYDSYTTFSSDGASAAAETGVGGPEAAAADAPPNEKVISRSSRLFSFPRKSVRAGKYQSDVLVCKMSDVFRSGKFSHPGARHLAKLESAYPYGFEMRSM